MYLKLVEVNKPKKLVSCYLNGIEVVKRINPMTKSIAVEFHIQVVVSMGLNLPSDKSNT